MLGQQSLGYFVWNYRTELENVVYIFQSFIDFLFFFLQERSAQARIMDLESQLSRSTQSTQLLKRTKEEVCQQSFSLKKSRLYIFLTALDLQREQVKSLWIIYLKKIHILF